MSGNAKRALVSLLGGAGLILLLVGAMTDAYSTTTGVILMFACWLGSGVLARFWGMGGRQGRAE